MLALTQLGADSLRGDPTDEKVREIMATVVTADSAAGAHRSVLTCHSQAVVKDVLARTSAAGIGI
jgi:hypothetical protein